jgi:sigma-B regulation protein RsbU (phosphoserine phosphatase)
MTASRPTEPPGFEKIRALTDVSRALTRATSTEQVLRLAVERAADLLEADSAVLMLTDNDGLLRVRATHGVSAERVAEFSEPLAETLVRRLQGLFDYVPENSFLSVPLIAQGHVTGLLAAVRIDGRPCTDADEWLLSALGDQAAVALENARLAGEVRRESEERVRATTVATESSRRALSTLGHDLRSPLTAIDAYAALLEEGLYGPLSDQQLEVLARIRMSGRHLLGVLENVLEMARLHAGVVQIAWQDVSVADVLEEAVQMAQPWAAQKQHRLSIDAAPQFVVRAEPSRLREALLNILGNAVKYTPAGGTVRASTSLRHRDSVTWAAIAVTDSGPGIPPDMREAIFEPYVRAAGTDNVTGAGLGLSIAREVMRQMGGEIEVVSELGNGATFTLLLPVVPAGFSGLQ